MNEAAKTYLALVGADCLTAGKINARPPLLRSGQETTLLSKVAGN